MPLVQCSGEQSTLAIAVSPAWRPHAAVRRHHPDYWCNVWASKFGVWVVFQDPLRQDVPRGGPGDGLYRVLEGDTLLRIGVCAIETQKYSKSR